MKTLILIGLCWLLLTGCSSIDASLPISGISVQEQGLAQDSRPEMTQICKGFLMSHNKLQAFYEHASIAPSLIDEHAMARLPCFAKGTAYLYGEKTTWRLYAGGVAEFYNENKRIVKVCGIKCCRAVQGIC